MKSLVVTYITWYLMFIHQNPPLVLPFFSSKFFLFLNCHRRNKPKFHIKLVPSGCWLNNIAKFIMPFASLFHSPSILSSILLHLWSPPCLNRRTVLVLRSCDRGKPSQVTWCLVILFWTPFTLSSELFKHTKKISLCLTFNHCKRRVNQT